MIKKQGTIPTEIQKNEFNEQSFVFKRPNGVSWQIIEKKVVKNKPVTKLEFQSLNNQKMFLQTQPAQLSKFTESLFSLGFFVLLLVALYFAFKIFNRNKQK